MKILVILIFLAAYLLLVFRRGHPFVVLGSAVAALLISGAININQAVSSVDYNVLGVFLGTMILSGLFINSSVPAYLATRLVDRSKNVGIAMLSVCLLSG